MKKLVLSLIAVVTLCGAVSAQGFGWGAKVGFNVSNISNSNLNSKVGLTAGVFGVYEFSSPFAVSANLLYSREGGRDGDYALKEHYLNIPILFNAYIIPGLAVKAGIQPGFMLGAKAKDKINGSRETENVSDAFTTMDFSIPVGVSYELPFAYGIILDARYNIGVANVLKVGTARNNYFSITAGVRF